MDADQSTTGPRHGLILSATRDPGSTVEYAIAAEEAGWDGVFHIVPAGREMGWDDPAVAVEIHRGVVG